MQFEKMINTITLGNCYELIRDIPDKTIDCIYVDIPYLIKRGGRGKSFLAKRIDKVQNTFLSDIRDGIDYSILEEFIRISKKINCFIWCSKEQIYDILKFFKEKGYMFEILVWLKTNPTPATNNVWLPDIEYCLYFREKGVLLNDGYEHKSKWYTSPINKPDKDKYKHPTIKPLELVKKHLQHATNKGDIILDCFSGSGTTCVAAKELERKFIGIEINQEYYEISLDRLNGILANGQISFDTEIHKEE